MVVLCIMTLALSTVPALQRKLSKCELLEYLEHSDHDVAEKARIKLGDPDCSGSFFHDEEENIEEIYYNWEEEEALYIDGILTTSTSNISLPRKKIRLFALEVLEHITAAFFTVDLLLRLITCPSILRFFRSLINIFDILAVVGFYIHIIVINTQKEYKYENNWIRFINYLQIFRVMRLFRIVRNVRASRVLSFSLRQNARDMTLLVLLVMIGVSTSASLIYFIEDRTDIESIPIGWYWAMITLTTVGYGDITPKTGLGRIVAAFLAICGVLLLAVTLPMFVNNFLTLYQYSCLDDKIEEQTTERRKFKGAINVVAVAQVKEDDTNMKNKNDPNLD